MKSAEHRHSMDASVCCTRTWNRLLLFERLMWTRLIVEAHVLGDDAPEMILAEDEHVVEQLSPERSHESFSERIHVRCAYRGTHHPHAR